MCTPDIPDPPPQFLPIPNTEDKVAKVRGKKKRIRSTMSSLASLAIPLTRPTGALSVGSGMNA